MYKFAPALPIESTQLRPASPAARKLSDSTNQIKTVGVQADCYAFSLAIFI
jgi:hypothetical protein